MPCQRYYELVKGHRGDWILKASCTVKDKTLTAYGAATLTVMEDISLTNEQCKSVEAINAALEAKIEELQEKNAKAEADMYTIIAYLTDTKPNTYRGRIKIPDAQVDGVELWVQIMGVGQNQGVEKIPVTLSGGIYSDTIPFSAAGINFKGAGEEYATWPEGRPNEGKPNVAFDGNSMSNVSNCTFTGYDIAIKCGTSLRMFGRYNTFTKNHIAWKLSEECEGDGNPDAQSCVFKKNDYALYVENFNGFPSSYAPRYCRFIDNGYDVYNGSGRWWFIPGNYFTHSDSLGPGPVNEAVGNGNTFCYPMARNGTVDYTQLDEDGDTVSNALTSTYRTPESELSGKTFKVADTVMVAGTEKDTVLATFSFPEETETATQALAAPAIALFAAEPVVQETPKSFDATVTVDRSDASKIEFTMQDPCKQVNVSLPCSFTDGTVKLGETEIPDAEFDGQTVFFQTDEAGTYVIESKTPVQPKPDDAITGIISGIVASGALQPGAPVTREQLCAILCRYAALTGKNTAASASLDAFTDRAQVSAYAEASVRWALQAGLLTGVGDGRLAPRSGATRAQLAVLLQRFAGLK